MIDFFSYEKNQIQSLRGLPRQTGNVPFNWRERPSEGCSCNSCLSELHRDKMSLPVNDYVYSVSAKRDKPKQDHFYFLCDYVLHGYALNERRWGKI
jgi:hypothetical protein